MRTPLSSYVSGLLRFRDAGGDRLPAGSRLRQLRSPLGESGDGCPCSREQYPSEHRLDQVADNERSNSVRDRTRFPDTRCQWHPEVVSQPKRARRVNRDGTGKERRCRGQDPSVLCPFSEHPDDQCGDHESNEIAGGGAGRGVPSAFAFSVEGQASRAERNVEQLCECTTTSTEHSSREQDGERLTRERDRRESERDRDLRRDGRHQGKSNDQNDVAGSRTREEISQRAHAAWWCDSGDGGHVNPFPYFGERLGGPFTSGQFETAGSGLRLQAGAAGEQSPIARGAVAHVLAGREGYDVIGQVLYEGQNLLAMSPEDRAAAGARSDDEVLDIAEDRPDAFATLFVYWLADVTVVGSSQPRMGR